MAHLPCVSGMAKARQTENPNPCGATPVVAAAATATAAPLLLPTHLLHAAAQKDHIVLGTDNFFTNSRTKWDQYIGERPPRTRGVPGELSL